MCPPAWHAHAGIPELLALLRAQGKEVFLVSGGFRNIIHPLARSLQIPEDHVFANSILFDVSEGWGQGSLVVRAAL